jgi:hypothetical protein
MGRGAQACVASTRGYNLKTAGFGFHAAGYLNHRSVFMVPKELAVATMQTPRNWTLIGQDGKPYQSDSPGTLGGHKGTKIYGRLQCRSALQAIARNGYIKHRVFFLDEDSAVSAGYRPCSVCMPEQYALWKAKQSSIHKEHNK